ncbi:MAG: DUF4230 domain-containing protein [Bacteroidota bacterium]
MKRFLAGALITLTAVLVYRSCETQNKDRHALAESSMLIEQQIAQVSKLIVTEGHFAQVYNYEDSKELLGAMLTADKKALVVVNAKVAISYDLSALSIEVDSVSRTVRLQEIPEPEIHIDPDLEYYDVQSDYFNPFGAKDYNEINQNIRAALRQKVEASSLISNAENRLVTELSQLLVLINRLGWTLQYNSQPITSVDALTTAEIFKKE